MIEKDSISCKKSLIKSIIQDFKKIIDTIRFRHSKQKMKILRRRLYLDKKAADDKKEDDAEYLQDIISLLNKLKESYSKEIKYYGQDKGIESIRYLFDEDKD